MLDETLHEGLFYIALPFMQIDGYSFVDLNTQDGDITAQFLDACIDTQNFVLCNTTDAARKRFKGHKRVEILQSDIMRCYTGAIASCTLAVFAFGDLPLSKRYELAAKIFNQTKPGGALIVVDKVRGSSQILEKAIESAALAMNAYAYTVDTPHIVTKVPTITAKQTETYLACAGFREIDCFYRSFDVAGFIAVRSEGC